jgi:hypothetical protein
MANKKQFGETVEGYNIPVLNEREIRAAAGILFLMVFIGLMLIISNENFVFIKYVITSFLIDFIIRVFVNPKYAPTLIIARMIVSRQNPEYVGAVQKKFAWLYFSTYHVYTNGCYEYLQSNFGHYLFNLPNILVFRISLWHLFGMYGLWLVL